MFFDASQYITNQQGEQTAVVLLVNEFLELMEDLIAVASRKSEATTSHDDFLIDLENDGLETSR